MIQQKSFANSSRLSAPQETNDLFAVFYFGYIGGLTAISWAAVLNSLDYFKLMFPSYDVEFVFPNGPNTATLLLSFVITHLSNYISYSTRIITSICGLILMLAIIPFEASLLRETEFGMLVIMGLLFGVGLFANMIYTSIGGYVSQIDGKFTAAFLIGIAISNIIMNILRELTLIIFNPISDAELPPIVAYFILTIGLMLLGLVIHNQFIHSSFHASVEQRKGGYTNSVEDGLEGALIQRPKPKKDIKTLVEVFSRIWFCWGILFIACIQLNTVYPGVMLKKPVDGILPHTKTVSMIATYSCFAIIGKKLGQYRHMYNKSMVTVILMLRFIMFGLFIVQATTVSIPILNTVWFGYLNIALFALTYGFVLVAGFILVPENEKSANNKEVAGFLSVFAVNIGTMIGGLLCLFFRNYQVPGQDPASA